MAKKHPNQDSSSDLPPQSQDDPDLGFASESHHPFGPGDRKAFDKAVPESEEVSPESTWSPEERQIEEADIHASESAASSTEQESDTDDPAQDTWVPDKKVPSSDGDSQEFDPDSTWVTPAPETQNQSAEDPAEEAAGFDADSTWVLPPTSQQSGSDDSEDDQGDFEKTWVPSSTPTADGIPDSDSDDDLSTGPEDGLSEDPDPNSTWVPSKAPTVDGMPNDPPQDADQTWMPSNTPTADGLPRSPDDSRDPGVDSTWVLPPSRRASSDDPSAHDEEFEKTWVPSDTPTADGVTDTPDGPTDSVDADTTWVMPPSGPTSDHGAPTEPDDFEKTWVPSEDPTTSGLDRPDKQADFEKTIEMSPDRPADSNPDFGSDKTVDLGLKGNADGDDGQGEDVFQKTIGMRRPLDLSDLPSAALSDDEATRTIHLDLPDQPSDSKDMLSTQLWARQSGANLNQSLTIRSRPVAGDEQFEISGQKEERPDYEIVEKIGEGGMGAIFLATQTSLDRQLAIKTLKANRGAKRSRSGSGRSSSADQQRRDMFLAEALITANLVHPHIIPIHDLCETADGLPFYSMKRVVGTPWCDKLRNMDLDENLEVLKKVCDAVAYAHHNGVVNRDLKPENVMLGEFGEVLVLDWGLAVPSTPADKKRFSSPSAPFGAGTPAYMAPELWTGPEEIIGYWSDIYLLGAILFEIVTGKAPHKFSEPSQKAGNSGLWMVIDKVVRRNDIRPTKHRGELIDIAMKAMSTRPKDRYESVLKFQEALKEFQRHEESRRLTERASKALASTQDAGQESGYLAYQSAAALYEEAQSAWTENQEATTGLRETRLQYAMLAHAKGDYDLGLQIATLEDGEAFVAIQDKLTRSRRLRNALKTAVIAACGIICAVGLFSFIQSREIAEQNRQIVQLNGTRESLQSDISKAQEAIATTEAKREEAESQAIEAQARAVAAAEEAEDAALQAEMAVAKTMEAQEKLEKSETLLAEADSKIIEANAKLARADLALKETTEKVAQLEVRKARSAVDLKNAEIASLIRSGDYSTALAEVDRLLKDLTTSPEMASLPEAEQQQREVELQARRRQLLQRAVRVETPVQSQVISSDGKLVVWGDQQGRLQVREYLSEGRLSDRILAETQLPATADSVSFAESNQTIVAASGNTIHLWNFQQQQNTQLNGHSGNVTAIRCVDDFILSADSSGTIKAWSMQDATELWSMKTSSRILDIELLPKAQMFIYAGSRGGQSADILAYQLGGLSDSKQRPLRLGQLRLPRDQNNPPRALAVSPDEAFLLVSNSRNGQVFVLPRRQNIDAKDRDKFPFVHASDLAEERTEKQWIADRHQRPVNDVSFSTDGSRFCTASDDRTIGVWKITDGEIQLIERLEGHGARVNSADFVGTGAGQIISAAADRYCRIWDVEKYRQQKQQLELEFQLSVVMPPFIRNGLALLRETGTQLPFIMPASFSSLTSLIVSDELASGDLQTTNVSPGNFSTDESVAVLNKEPEVHRGGIQSVEFSGDGRYVTTGGRDGTAVLWEVESGQPVTTLSTAGKQDSNIAFDEGHDFNVSRFRFLPPDGRFLLTTGFDGALCIWDADVQDAGTGHQRLRVSGLGLVNAMATSADGLWVAMSSLNEGSHPGDCRIYRTDELLKATSPQPAITLTGFHSGEISSIDLSSDGSQAVTGGRDGKVALWSCRDGRRLAGGRIHVKNTIVSSLKLLNDGQILTAGYDGRLLLLVPRTSSKSADRAGSSDRKIGFDVQRRFEHGRVPIERVAMHPDGRHFVTLSIKTDKRTKAVGYTLEHWTVAKEAPLEEILPAIVGDRPPSRIYSASFSSDGSQLAAVVDQRLQLFDTANWKVTRVLNASSAGMSDAIFCPVQDQTQSSSRIATFNGVAAQLWDLDKGESLAGFRPLFSVKSVTRSQHSTPLLATADRSIRFFQAQAGNERFGQSVFKIEDPHSGITQAVQFNPARLDLLASTGTDRTVCFWSWNQSALEARLIGKHKLPEAEQAEEATENIAVDLQWTKDGQTVWVAGQHGDITGMDATGQIQYSGMPFHSRQLQIFDLDVSTDRRFVAISGRNLQTGLSTASIFERSPQNELLLHCQLQGHEAGGTRAIKFVPDSPYVVTAGADGACLVWNWMPERTDEKPIEAYEAFQFLDSSDRVAHKAPINAVSVAANGDVATVSDDGTMKLWRNPFGASRISSP